MMMMIIVGCSGVCVEFKSLQTIIIFCPLSAIDCERVWTEKNVSFLYNTLKLICSVNLVNFRHKNRITSVVKRC